MGVPVGELQYGC